MNENSTKITKMAKETKIFLEIQLEKKSFKYESFTLKLF